MGAKNFVNQFKNTRRLAGLQGRRPLVGLTGLQGRRPLGGLAGLQSRRPPVGPGRPQAGKKAKHSGRGSGKPGGKAK